MSFRTIAIQYLESPDFNSLSDNSKLSYQAKIKVLSKMKGSMPTLYSNILAFDCGNSTKNVYIAVMKAVLRWAFRVSLVDEDLAARLPRKQLTTTPFVQYYTREEIDKFKAIPEGTYKVYADLMVALFYTGTRPSELLNLRWEDVDKEYISIRGAKGREGGKISRKCAIIPEVRSVLDRAEVRINGQYVFATERGKPLDQSKVRKMVQAILKELRLPKKQVRGTRPGLAKAMLESGYTIYEIQGQLGHKSISTTERYLKLTMEEKAGVFKGLK